MLGAIIGDIAGSPYEFGGIKTKDFVLFSNLCRPTDDSVMTIAVGLACVHSDVTNERDFKNTLVSSMRHLGNLYRDAGYGGRFYRWLTDPKMKAYGSYGNGSAMRVSPVAYAENTLEKVERLAKWSAEVTHNDPAGIAGAQATAGAIFLARTGASKAQIKEYIEKKYYDLDFTLDGIRPTYSFDVTCPGSVPEAIVCFLEGNDYEDTIRNAVSLGGDSDTQAAIAGAIAEAYYGIPDEIAEKGLEYLDDDLKELYYEYSEELYG